jgi:hypothetical protein
MVRTACITSCIVGAATAWGGGRRRKKTEHFVVCECDSEILQRQTQPVCVAAGLFRGVYESGVCSALFCALLFVLMDSLWYWIAFPL